MFGSEPSGPSGPSGPPFDTRPVAAACTAQPPRASKRSFQCRPPTRAVAEVRALQGRRGRGHATSQRTAQARQGHVGGRCVPHWTAPAGCRRHGGWFGQLEGLVKVYSDCEITPSSSSAPAPALTGGCHGWHEAGSYPIIDNDDALWNCGNLAAGAQAWAAALAREISNGLWAPASPPSGFSATVSGRPQAGQVHIAGWDMVLGPLMR